MFVRSLPPNVIVFPTLVSPCVWWALPARLGASDRVLGALTCLTPLNVLTGRNRSLPPYGNKFFRHPLLQKFNCLVQRIFFCLSSMFPPIQALNRSSQTRQNILPLGFAVGLARLPGTVTAFLICRLAAILKGFKSVVAWSAVELMFADWTPGNSITLLFKDAEAGADRLDPVAKIPRAITATSAVVVFISCFSLVTDLSHWDWRVQWNWHIGFHFANLLRINNLMQQMAGMGCNYIYTLRWPWCESLHCDSPFFFRCSIASVPMGTHLSNNFRATVNQYCWFCALHYN